MPDAVPLAWINDGLKPDDAKVKPLVSLIHEIKRCLMLLSCVGEVHGYLSDMAIFLNQPFRHNGGSSTT